MDFETYVGTHTSSSVTHAPGLRTISVLAGVGIAVAALSSPVGGDIVAIGCGLPVPAPDPNDAECHLKRNAQCIAPIAPVFGFSADFCGTKSLTGGSSVDCGYHNATGGGC